MERYVPANPASSLVSDAPGYGTAGPICWKCRGTQIKSKACKVCGGCGHLRTRHVEAGPGKITRGRRGVHLPSADPAGWREPGVGDIARKATESRVDVSTETLHELYRETSWIPQAGEELCNLTGNWRILQRVGSHRWTTDDLVTAAIASKFVSKDMSYCDLGTGNGSVLNMVLWAATSSTTASISRAIGIEARKEAFQLARRTLAFNIGTDVILSNRISVEHADFRAYKTTETYDLITGTPPYFRVDFNLSCDATVEKALIRQGGMPSAMQSAPARCEFRGGFEAYCVAAKLLLNHDGVFCICENYANHERALKALRLNDLHLSELIKVEGKQGRGPLFCVYVIKRKPAGSLTTLEFAVRDCNGAWTQEYIDLILKQMAIPSAF